MSKVTCFGVLFLAGLLAGCSPGRKFQAEQFAVAGEPMQIKAWIKGDELCVEVRLRDEPRMSIHEMQLIDPQGLRQYADKWTDRTSYPQPPRLGFGVGYGRGYYGPGGSGFGYRGMRDGYDDYPYDPYYQRTGPRSAVDACWKPAPPPLELEGWRMLVSLLRVGRTRIELVTVPLSLTAYGPRATGDAVEINFQLAGEPITQQMTTAPPPAIPAPPATAPAGTD